MAFDRVVCLTEETVETMYLLGQDHRIVGVTGYAIRPPRVRREKPRVGAFTSADCDKISALNPDLVLTFSDLQADIAAELIRRGFAVHAFNQRSVRGILDMITTLGRLFDCADAANDLVTEFQNKLDRLAATAHNPPLRVYFEEWDDPPISGIGWVSELLRYAGGVDVFANVAKEQGAKSRILDAQDIIAAAPDLIIASWCGKKVVTDKIKSRTGWDRIPAVQNDLVFEIKSPLILQPGPAALTDGLDKLCDILRLARDHLNHKEHLR